MLLCTLHNEREIKNQDFPQISAPNPIKKEVMSRESYDILNRIHEADGQLNYGLAVFGDEIAKREGYRELEGLEAVHFYLIQKHHWLPRDVKSMSFDDLRFVLTEEMSGWTWPAEARPSTGT